MVKRRACCLGLVLLLACHAPEHATSLKQTAVDETTPQDGGTVVRRLESDIATLNPVIATSRYDRNVDFFLFTPLIHLDQSLRPVAGLAESWEISPDGRLYTFHLNPKATFSDGTPVRASDVVFTLRKIADPATEAAQIASGFEQLDPAQTRALDDHTVVVAFKEALAAQLVRFNDLLVVPEHVYGRGDFKTAFNDTPVGSGPYRLVRRTPGSDILLARRADYWDTKPYLQNILFKVLVDSKTAWEAVQHGDIDETPITSDTWLMESRRPELQARLDFRRFYTLNYNYIAWNGKRPLFADKRVRRALGMCVDLASIINNLYHGTARAMSGPFTPDEWAYNPDVPVLPYDPAGARQLLASAGWTDSNHDGVLDRAGKPLEFDLYVFSGSLPGAQIAQLFQQELKKAGVVMKIVTLDPATMIQRVIAGNYDAAYMGWELDPDPDQFNAFHSSQFPPKGQNFIYYANPEADRLIEAGRRELDFEKRKAIYHEIHAILAADQPYTWMIQVSVKWAMNKRVKNAKESRGYGLFGWFPGEYEWWIPRAQRTHEPRPAGR